MLKTILAAAAALVLTAAPVLAQGVESYDENWHRAPFWSGEYPDGFTVLTTTIVHLRPSLDPKEEKTIACELPARATYHPWNAARVDAQGLAFVSFTRIADYIFIRPFDTTLTRVDDGTAVPLSFQRGDRFRFLVYYAEGAFLMEHDGVRYDGDQSLFDASEQVGDSNGYEEWLRINCSNNQWGWLFMGDIQLDDSAYAGPNITEYGRSEDLQ